MKSRKNSTVWVEQVIYKLSDRFIEENLQINEDQSQCFVQFFDEPVALNEMQMAQSAGTIHYGSKYYPQIFGGLWNDKEGKNYKGYSMSVWWNGTEPLTKELCSSIFKALAKSVGYEFRLTFFKVNKGIKF